MFQSEQRGLYGAVGHIFGETLVSEAHKQYRLSQKSVSLSLYMGKNPGVHCRMAE